MENRPSNPAHAEIVGYEKRATREHHHRGKSSESLLDKAAILMLSSLSSMSSVSCPTQRLPQYITEQEKQRVERERLCRHCRKIIFPAL